MSKLKLKDIAKHFDVSVSTVSKAINDSHEVSLSLKKKIQSYANKHHYRPNMVALNLRQRSTKTIGVVIPNILNYFFVKVLYGIEKIADERGYSIVTCITNQSFEKETKTLEYLNTGVVDGVIFSTAAEESQFENHSKYLEELTESNLPIVMFDRATDFDSCDKVVVDDFEAGYKAAKYLIKTGCKALAIATPINQSKISRLRIDGYKKALKEYNISLDKKLIVPISNKEDIELTMSFLLNYKKIDGIIILDEITAVKVMKIVQKRGYKIPEDISIIGFTNGQLSRYVSPSLTTISQHGTHIGETTAKILIDKIEGKIPFDAFETTTVKTSLVVRDSTKALK